MSSNELTGALISCILIQSKRGVAYIVIIVNTSADSRPVCRLEKANKRDLYQIDGLVKVFLLPAHRAP